jgi:TatD DNase family protein
MQLVDTHCHIHQAVKDAGHKADHQGRERYEKDGQLDPDSIIERAQEDDVTRLICVGTTLKDSELACEFVHDRENTWASIGIHPHEAKDHLVLADQKRFMDLAGKPKVVAVGECGLDYYYTHSPKEEQVELLHLQLGLAQKHGLPVIFHVRDAFDDFWPVFDQYKGVRGVIHSFSATRKELDEILARNLYVGLNGIMTFTKDSEQLEAAKAVPSDRLLLETDAPFLTPHPYRGTICEPKHIRVICEFLANVKGESVQDLAQTTTQNAQALFKI